MGKSRVSSPAVVGSERTDVAERVVEFLRRRHPVKPAECIASSVCISVSTAQKWIERSSAPSSWMLVKMIHHYGPEFLAAVMGELAPEWLNESAHTERRARIAANIQKLQAELDAI